MKKKILVYPLIMLMLMSFTVSQDAHAATPNAAPADLTLGGLFPLTGSLSGGGVERRAAFEIAVEEINADTTLLPATTLKFLIRDTATDATTGATVAQELLDLGVHGLVGAASSGVSKAIAEKAEIAKVPQISYSSTNADLSDKAEYPYFLRVVPPDSVQGVAIADILYTELGITTVATLATSDDYGSGGIGVFETAYKALGGTVATSQKYVDAAPDVGTQLQAIVDSDATTIVLNAVVGNTKTVFAQAADAGISPSKGYQWVGTDGSSQNQVFTDENNVVDEDIRDAMAGMFGTAPNRGEGAIYNTFLDTWEDCNGKTTADYAGCGDREPNTFATFAYDAAYAFAHAFQAMITADADPTDGALLLAELATTTFTGATGAVAFDANYDRLGVYDLLNHNGTVFVDIGNWDKDNGLVTTAAIQYASAFSTEDADDDGLPGFGAFIAIFSIAVTASILRRRK